ncbi:hypothetical protein K2173_008346 [Erythroxylum novogranatense]|uniref:Phytocyanin domain-containing protein n=1 Tax=Erythroxylum novogranatense TaxID=1862640 RepID=A0AAV8TIP2_9ROSI|nr:hypothetical protein K2173_008346 [Erythroxylum novogranatense]
MEVLRRWVFLLMVVVGECREPVLHRVGGGKYTWLPGSNYTEWASHERFYVGDWLYFGFDIHKYSVYEVTQTNFGSCMAEDFITNITRGGRDVFNLTDARPYYFIDGRGYCSKGMKLAITAVNAPLDDQETPKTSHDSSSSKPYLHQLLTLLFAITLASFFLQ